MFAKLLLAFIALQVLLVNADPDPLTPAPGDKYHEGGSCLIEWDTDDGDTWQDMEIVLMTGSNTDMVELKLITTVDATQEDSYSYPCPQVYPNSAIYFYEFRTNEAEDVYWTGRFTITDKNGNSTSPTQSTQPNGEKVPWGTGMLINATNTLPSSNTSFSPPTSTPASNESASPSIEKGNGDMTVVVSKALVFTISLVTVSTVLFS